MARIDSLPDVPGLARHGEPVRCAFVRAVESLGWNQAQADMLAALIAHESGWRAEAVNPTGGASGLIQFMPATARMLGSSVDEIRQMDEVQQLPLVAKYFRPLGPTIAPRDIPIGAFLPSLVGQPDDRVTFERGAIGYEQNAALDTDKDGRITLGEVRDRVGRVLAAAQQKPRLPIDGGPAGASPSPPPSSSGGGGGIGVFALLALVGVAVRRLA